MKRNSKTFEQRLKDTQKQVSDLGKAGFQLIGTTHKPIVSHSAEGQYDKTAAESFFGGSTPLGGGMLGGSFLESKQEAVQPVLQAGTKGKGYIKWGSDDHLPLHIYRHDNALPYTATGNKYLTDLMYGLGPKLMYKYPRYASQTVTEELIPFEQAGVLLRHLIIEARNRIARQSQEQSPAVSDFVPPVHSCAGSPVSDSSASPITNYRTRKETTLNQPEPTDFDTIGTPEDELKRLIADYKEWERTNTEYQKFLEDNDVDLVYQQCCMDDVRLDISFPIIGLNQGSKNQWDAKIVKVDALPAVCCRMEEMDDKLYINNIYYAERLREDNTKELRDREIVAYPSLMPKDMLPRLRSTVEAYRSRPVSQRPLWFCCPEYYPSGARPYYPQPAWWSIFSSLVYNYASTLVTDKAIARKNSTMWGKLIFINLNYLARLADQMGLTKPEDVDKLKDDIVSSINEFLRDRKNNGKTCTLENYIGPDGKTVIDSIKLVDVPAPANATATAEELGAVANIVFFALGINPALVGVTINSGSNGGTFQRELHLLKQQQMSPRQRRQLTLWNRIARFNHWDRHAEWVIKMPVLTTLDRSATGLTETESE